MKVDWSQREYFVLDISITLTSSSATLKVNTRDKCMCVRVRLFQWYHHASS